MKNNFEKININAEKRREKAEEEGALSISHWRGNLHGHSREDISNPELPLDIVENRKGSNCGQIPLDALLAYHNRAMKNEFVAITEHSRDGNTEKAISGMTDWFLGMYLANNTWLEDNYLKQKKNLSDSELDEIRSLAKSQAEEVALYGDERIEEILSQIDNNKEEGINVFKGIEVSLLPDGSFDSELPSSGDLDLVVCSVHPKIDKEGFEEIVSSPEQYSDLIVKGVSKRETNIIGHIGYGLEEDVVKKLDWEKIAQAAIDNYVALEVNLKDLISYVYDEILNYDKHPKDDVTYRDELISRLDDLVPLLGSKSVRGKLKPFIENGLKITINIDEHKNKYIEHHTDKDETSFNLKARDLRYWRSMKILEKYFNNIFDEMGIKEDNIINTYTKDRLEYFFEKRKV